MIDEAMDGAERRRIAKKIDGGEFGWVRESKVVKRWMDGERSNCKERGRWPWERVVWR